MTAPTAHPKEPTFRLKPRVKSWEIQGSPHVRGDGPRPASTRPLSVVLPTCVGMVRYRHGLLDRSTFSPRAWGWSALPQIAVHDRPFSPRAWGWSGIAD